jgi:hypothetical protein
VDSEVLQIQTQATTSGRDESLLTWDPVPSRQYELCALNDGRETSVQECTGSACDVVKDTAVESTPAGEAETSSEQLALLALLSPPRHSSGGEEFAITHERLDRLRQQLFAHISYGPNTIPVCVAAIDSPSDLQAMV